MRQQQQQHPIPSEQNHYFHVDHRGFPYGAMDKTACSAAITTKTQKTTLHYQHCQPASLHEQHCLDYPTSHAAAHPALNHASMPAANHGCSLDYVLPTLLPRTLRYTWQQRTTTAGQTDGTGNREHGAGRGIPFPAHGKSPTMCIFLTWLNFYLLRTSTKSEPSPSTA